MKSLDKFNDKILEKSQFSNINGSEHEKVRTQFDDYFDSSGCIVSKKDHFYDQNGDGLQQCDEVLVEEVQRECPPCST